MTTETKALITVAILAVFDTVIPVPLTALIVIYAIIQRPAWVIGLSEADHFSWTLECSFHPKWCPKR
jgi:hypothetical protein